MTAATISSDHHLEGVPTRDVLEGFARLHNLILVFDATGRVVWLSDGLAALCDSPDRLLGSQWRELTEELPDPEPGLRLGRRFCERGSLNDVRLEIPRAHGEAIEVDVNAFHVESSAVGRDDAGSLTVAFLRPVEDRKRADLAVRDKLEFYGSVLDAIPDAIVAMDRSSFITFVNRAAADLLGESPESLRGKPAALFLPHASGFRQIVSSIQEHRELDGAEFELPRRSGEPMRLSISTLPLRDRTDAQVGTMALLRDVTESSGVRDKLERKNAELESYVHSVSHDLRSPLVSLLGFTRLLRQDYADLLDESGRHFLDRVEQAGRTMESLIHDLLELSQIEGPGDQRTLVDPRAVLMQLRAELKPRLEELGVELVLPSNPPLVLCDRTRLYQVFSNLVGNSLNHMGPCESPAVRVDVNEEESRHHIVVSDNGVGIARADHERIFEVFQTVGPRGESRRSTGIGLAIVKKIADTHGGEVWVESEPGCGAAFHFTLPR